MTQVCGCGAGGPRGAAEVGLCGEKRWGPFGSHVQTVELAESCQYSSAVMLSIVT